MGGKDVVLPELSMKNYSLKCLTFEERTRKPYNDNLRLFRPLALDFHGKERLREETSNLFNLFLEKKSGTDSVNFRGGCMESIATLQDIFQADNFLYDIEIVDGSLVGELASRNTGKHFKTV